MAGRRIRVCFCAIGVPYLAASHLRPFHIVSGSFIFLKARSLALALALDLSIAMHVILLQRLETKRSFASGIAPAGSGTGGLVSFFSAAS